MRNWVCRTAYICGASIATDGIWQNSNWATAETFFGVFIMLYIFGAGLAGFITRSME